MQADICREQVSNRRRRPAPSVAMLAIAALVAFVLQPLGASPHSAEASQTAQQQRPLPCSPTLAVTEGPFWRVGSPARTTLIYPGMAGVRVLVTGYVYDANCQPIANAWLDFWQANYYGQYDNTGYTLRGHEY